MPSAIDVEVLVNGVSFNQCDRICRRLETAVANYASKASEIALIINAQEH